MSTTNQNGTQPEKTESPKQASACCGPGCGCGRAGKVSKGRWVVGAIVLAAAGVMVVRGMVRSDRPSTQVAPAGFVNPAATETAASGSATKSPAAEASVGTTIGAFAELNTVACTTDAVFVYMPGKEGPAVNAPSTPIKAAARALEAKGLKCGVFTLKPGSADYAQIAKQMAVPGVLALVKGRGMSAVSGEVTEAKLLQGYVAASSASSCCPTASPGCCPK